VESSGQLAALLRCRGHLGGRERGRGEGREVRGIDEKLEGKTRKLRRVADSNRRGSLALPGLGGEDTKRLYTGVEMC
jgi:hypothetical protein